MRKNLPCKPLSFSELRELNALTIDDAAKLLGVSPKTIYRWEKTEQPSEASRKVLQLMLERERKARPERTFDFIDLFAGIGGIRKGFEAIGGECIFTSEWDRHAQRTYRANFGDEHSISGDIRAVATEDIPAHDVLLAGFPCQPFSLAGVSKSNSLGRKHGFAHKTQGTLFFDVLRILKHHRPKAVLLENVKNLKSHNKGDTFRTILHSLQDLGYRVSFKVIDAAGYVPQHRERIFIVGFMAENTFDLSKIEFADPKKGPKLGSILHHPAEQPEYPYTLEDVAHGSNAESFVNTKYTLSSKLWTYLQSYSEKHRRAGNGFGFGLCYPEDKARTLSARYHKDGSEILVHQASNNPRRLTPRECARLMGYDQKGTQNFIIPVSDTQAYRQFGNSVVVPVVEAIAREMKPYIQEMILN